MYLCTVFHHKTVLELSDLCTVNSLTGDLDSKLIPLWPIVNGVLLLH